MTFPTVSVTPGTGQTINTLPNAGQDTMNNSLSVVLASDQSAVPVSGTVTANISGTVPVSGTFWQATQPISGSVSLTGTPTVNVGTRGWTLASGTDSVTATISGTVSVSGTVSSKTQDGSGNAIGADSYGSSGYYLHVDASNATTDGTTYNSTNVPQIGIVGGKGTDGNSHPFSTDANGNIVTATGPTQFVFSTNNSSTTNLAAGASFVGTIEDIRNYNDLSLLVNADQPFTVSIAQFIDAGGTTPAGPPLVASSTYVSAGSYRYSKAYTINGNYIQVTVTNTGSATTTAFNANAAYGNIPAVDETGYQAVVGGLLALPSGSGATGSVVVRPNPPSRFKADFNLAVASGLNTQYWTQIRAGTFATVSQTGGAMSLAANTSANDEVIWRSKTSFTNAIALKWQTTLSQRIANNNFFVELVDVVGDTLPITVNSATSVTITFPSAMPDGTSISSALVGQSMYIGALTGFTGVTYIPGRYTIASVSGNTVTFTVASWATGSVNTGTCSVFGWNYYQIVYNGASATNTNFDAQRRGYATGATVATINTTASPGHIGIVTSEDDMVSFSDQLSASGTTNIQSSVRATRVMNTPPYDVPLYVQLRSLNGTASPASNTTWTVNFVSVDAYTPQTVGISTVKAQGYQAQMPVLVGNVPSVNLSQIAGTTVVASVANGSTQKILPATLSTAVTQVDQSATAFAGSGSVLGTVVASAQGGGAVISAEINVSALTLGTATAVFAILQESRGGTNFSDIWTSDPITATGIVSMPAIPVAGRRRWRFFSCGGTSTTVTVTITALELPAGYVVMRQARDYFAATNPLASMFNSVALTASTIGTGATCMTTIGNATTPMLVEGCKSLTAFMTLTGTPTVTTQPVLTLQLSMDGTNWWSVPSATLTAAGAGTYMTTTTATAKFARLNVTTAAVYSAGNYTISNMGVNGVN